MIVLRVPAALKYRDVATRVVSAACKLVSSPGDSDRRQFDQEIVSAFGEAFNNIVVHAYRNVPLGEVTIEVDPQPGRLCLRLVDDGQSFDPESVSAPDLASLPESGMGLFIIRSFVDDVVYEPGTPNVLRLTKCL